METIFHSVARYTRFVRSTKVILSVLVAFLTGVVLFYPLTKNENAGIRIAFTSIEKGAASPTKMINARFHGMDKDDQPFNMTAVTATQKDANTLLLDKLNADISLKSGVWLSVAANTGVFTMKEKHLDLNGAVEMFDDQGYEFRTETMAVEVGSKKAVTHSPVEGQGPLGTLHSHGAIINGITQVIEFEGPVQVTLYTH